MKKLFLTMGLAAITAIGVGQEVLYSNGFDEPLELLGEISENDSIIISIDTSYTTSDWGHWSPRYKFERIAYYGGYNSSNIPTSYLHSPIGTFDVSELDSLVVELDAKVYSPNTGSPSISIQAITDNGTEFTFMSPGGYSFSYPQNDWSTYTNKLNLVDVPISTLELYLKIDVNGYAHSSEYDYYRGYGYFKLDQLNIIAYPSQSVISTNCQYDFNQDGQINAPDLIDFLAWYGTTAVCN